VTVPHHTYFFHQVIRESLAVYDLSAGEEIFLSYAHGRENGPGIERTGKGPPFMEDLSPGAVPGSKTTHPFGQRLRSWLIADDLRTDDLAEVRTEVARFVPAADPLLTTFDQALANLRSNREASGEALNNLKLAARDAALAAIGGASATGMDADASRVLSAFVIENAKLEAHDRHFVLNYPDHEVIGQQGCGDLTMNLWSVAYLHSALTPAGKPVMLYLHAEPVAGRTYPCLVKWLPVGNKPPRVTIEDMQFSPHATSTQELAWVLEGGTPRPVGDQIEFAVSGKPVIRHGKPVNLSRRTRQFRDLRHLLNLTNLNPKGKIPGSPDDTPPPRAFFARPQYNDVWFGEAQLLDDENLQRGAMAGPVVLSRLYAGLSVTIDHLRAALVDAGYIELTSPVKDLDPGEFRFVPGDDTLVEIYLRKATYAWNVMGLDAKQATIHAFACECRWGAAGRGYQLGTLAELMLERFGTHDALLFDEGQDVFQKSAVNGAFPKAPVFSDPALGPIRAPLDIIIPLIRKRLRACFLFARPRATPNATAPVAAANSGRNAPK
jgi:hypothetical protein